MEMIISGMDNKDLVQLTFSLEEAETELLWHHSAEFEYMEEMYDIVRTYYYEDSVSYWCWHDKEEKIIDENIDELVTRTLMNNPRNQESQKRINNHLKIHYLQCDQAWNSVSVFDSNTSFPTFRSSYSSICLIPPSPPPKLA